METIRARTPPDASAPSRPAWLPFAIGCGVAAVACVCTGLLAAGGYYAYTLQTAAGPAAATSPPVAASPQPPTAPGAPATPAPASGQIGVVSSFLIRDTFDTYHILGEVENGTGQGVYGVELALEVFDAGGQLLLEDQISTQLYNLAPGALSPFNYALYDLTGAPDHFNLRVVTHEVSAAEHARPVHGAINMLVDDSGNVHLAGELRNDTPNRIFINSIAGAVFAGDQGMIAAETSGAYAPLLEPGDRTPFRISTFSLGVGAPSTFKIYVDAETSEYEATPADQIQIVNTSLYYDSYGFAHLTGEASNQGSEALSLLLVAGVYDANGNVLDAATAYLPGPNLPPQTSQPFDFTSLSAISGRAGLIEQVDRYLIAPDRWWTYRSDTVSQPLRTAGVNVDASGASLTITGQVSNDAGTAFDNVVVWATLRDPQTNAVAGTDYGYVDALAAGASGDFTLYLDLAEDADPDALKLDVVAIGYN